MNKRQREASRVASTFHVATILLGIKTYEELLDLWGDVVPTPARVLQTGDAWHSKAVRVVRLRRHQVEAIAVPYMRLFRALHSGVTWRVDEADDVTQLSRLREDFVAAIQRYAPDALVDGHLPDPDPTDDIPAEDVWESGGREYTPYSLDDWLDDIDVNLEDLEWIQDELDAVEKQLEEEAHKILMDLGPNRLAIRLRKIAERDSALTHDELDARREEEHRKVGRSVSSHGERVTQNGGRKAEVAVGGRDTRVIGFVRVHDPRGHADEGPCGWCAMLMTKGFVPAGKKKSPMYRSKKSGGGERDSKDNNPDEFHAGDHCRAEQVFSSDQIDKDPRFNLNRKYADMYADRISGKYSGKSALTEWRRLIRNLKADRASA